MNKLMLYKNKKIILIQKMYNFCNDIFLMSSYPLLYGINCTQSGFLLQFNEHMQILFHEYFVTENLRNLGGGCMNIPRSGRNVGSARRIIGHLL